MSPSLRVLLVVCSVVICFFVMRRIRRSCLEVADSVFWLLIAAALIVVAVFPQLAFWASELLGFQAPVNLVFACGILVLLVRTFMQDHKIAVLKRKLTTLAQNEALREKDTAPRP